MVDEQQEAGNMSTYVPKGIENIWILESNVITSRKLSCLRYLQVTAFPNKQAFVPTARFTIQYPCKNICNYTN